MLPYYLLIFFPFFCEWVEYILHPNREHISSGKRSNFPIIVFFVIWFVMLALRHSTKCGWDLPQYEYYFYNVAELSFFEIFESYDTEQLFFVFNWIVAYINPDFRLFLVVAAFLCTGVVGWFYYKKSEFSLLTILLFITNSCFVMFYSGLRQSLALLLVVPAYYFTIKKRLFPFILTVILAKYIHNSAIMLALLYPVFHIPLRSKHFLLIMASVALFFLLKVPLFNYVAHFLSDNDKFSNVYAVETGASSVWFMFLLFLMYSFLLLDDSKMNSESLGLRNILVILTLVQSFASVNALAMRMNYYYILLLPVILPNLMNHPKVGNEIIVQFSRWVMVVFFTFYFFHNVLSGVGLGAFPYVAFWE